MIKRILLLLILLMMPVHAFANTTEVDLLLVLAADVSNSMDDKNMKLQRDGYATALESDEIFKAVKQGAYRKIAITYFEWGNTRNIIVPWKILDKREDFIEMANTLRTKPTEKLGMTRIGEALDVASSLLNSSPVVGERRVIDVSGDGPNNQGLSPHIFRDKLVNDGVVINGLPVIPIRYSDSLPPLDKYYEECVTGGPGHFVITAKSFNEFRDAIKMKLIIEIANLNITNIIRVSDEVGPIDCNQH